MVEVKCDILCVNKLKRNDINYDDINIYFSVCINLSHINRLHVCLDSYLEPGDCNMIMRPNTIR